MFAKTYNRKMGISGRLWKERYFSKVIETVKQFVTTFEYIVKNPLKAKLVRYARDYRYSGLYHYIHKIEGIIDLRGRLVMALYDRCACL